MTVEISVLGPTLKLDKGVYPTFLDGEFPMSNIKEQACFLIPEPSGSDIGVHIAFSTPLNYGSDPRLIVRGVFVGNGGSISLGALHTGRVDGDSIDEVYESGDEGVLSSAVAPVRGLFEYGIILTPSSGWDVGETVFLYFYRDDTLDTHNYEILLLDLLFRYTEIQ